MSHTSVHHRVQFTYDGDYTGDVTLTRADDHWVVTEITVPILALRAFIAEADRAAAIEALENEE